MMQGGVAEGVVIAIQDSMKHLESLGAEVCEVSEVCLETVAICKLNLLCDCLDTAVITERWLIGVCCCRCPCQSLT